MVGELVYALADVLCITGVGEVYCVRGGVMVKFCSGCRLGGLFGDVIVICVGGGAFVFCLFSFGRG